MIQTFPMQWAWRLALALLPLLGVIALVAGAAELGGLVDRGAWLGEARDAERWVAVAVGTLLLPFGLTALLHAKVTIDDEHFRYLGFGFLCKTRCLAFAEIRRWGHAVTRNQGRREPMLVFEGHDGQRHSVKLAMYSNQDGIRSLLAERLGAAAATSTTITGVTFDEPL
tara:strand:- start:22706 stop:23212 length:507 start_codon:yes stop_codon:yes gene_type:complete